MAINNITKTIKDLRDTIVGQVPLPNDQVNQITLALLYKFMDDMDRFGIEMGGVATFFSGDYEKYSWTKIMSNSLSAQQRYNLYAEGMEKMYSNGNLPDTFRSIFEDAKLPYRNPEILTEFLKIINSSFDYNEDSELLGTAYEGLLNILGASGDLGMFRTPRNIIDFIVSIVEPNKEDKILDPACGTAGFLISAYKYILSVNLDEQGKSNLTFDEKNKVLHNITGYDIAPSMVRISEMNLFLHGASEPKIYEYDTLTLDDKWNEKYECILANPPFMTPKGGIKPHNKFNIKSSKSEILFVDYINSHITSNGKAGIIVPDGVVFKQEKAFESVRKDLVENSLWAVVSLPSGIFQPYAGVSTSILFLDKKLAKQRDKIAFIELKNDGYSLNVKREPIPGNEIPELTKLLLEYKKDENFNSEKITIVSKSELANNHYDLSINKYRTLDSTPIEYEEVSVILERLKNRNKEYNDILNKLEIS